MMKRLKAQWERLDHFMVAFMTAHGTRSLRVALAVTFIWFGALKVLGRSPVADLVAQTVYWLPPAFFVRFLGWWELVIGVGLLSGVALRLILLSVWKSVAADSDRRICDQEPRPHRSRASDRQHGAQGAGMKRVTAPLTCSLA